jgi:hypothetical protein
MASTLVTLAAGGFGGAALKAAYDAWTQRRTWRREDLHRFAAMKQEVYANYLTVLSEYRRARRVAGYRETLVDEAAIGSPEEGLRRAEFVAAVDERRALQLRLMDTVHTMRLVGADEPIDLARQLEGVDPADGAEAYDDAVERYVAATRRDLRVSSASRSAVRLRKWWRRAARN